MNYKITLLVGVYPPAIGGPAIFAERFQRWSQTNDIQCHVITYSAFDSDSSSNVSRIRLNFPKIYRFLVFVWAIIRHSRDSDIIIANGCFLEVFVASFFLKTRYIVKLPGDPVWEYARNRDLTTLSIEEFQNAPRSYFLRILQFFFCQSYVRASLVICPSTQLRKFAQNWGVQNDKLRIIFNSVDPIQFSKVNLGVPQFDLVTTSRLVSWKNIDELIQIAADLNLSLAIAGDGPELVNLKALSSRLHARVTFLGEVENKQIPKILSNSRCFVLNSEFEATSYSLIEAKMIGMPVVARNSAGSSEVVRPGIDGFLVSGRTELKTAIACALSDAKISEYASEARQDALLRFNQATNFCEIVTASGRSDV